MDSATSLKKKYFLRRSQRRLMAMGKGGVRGARREKVWNHRRLIDVFRRIDGFGYEPTYTYKPFRSAVGSCLSLLTCGMMVYYTGATAAAWLGSAPVLQVDNLSTLDADFATKPPSFAVKLRENDEFWYEPSYVKVTFRHVSRNGKTGGALVMDMGTRVCDTPLGAALCPVSTDRATFKLQGRYTDPLYSYIEVAVSQCTQNCAANITTQDIADILVDKVDLVFIRTSQDFNPQIGGIVQDTTSDRWEFKSNTYYKVEAPWRKRSVLKESKYMGQQRDPHVLLTFSTYYTVLTDLETTFFKFFVRLDALESNERISPTATLLDICGRVEAVFSFLTVLTLGVVAWQYNRYVFKRRFTAVLTEAGVPPVAHDLRLFDCDYFNEVGELNPSVIRSTNANPRTAMDNLRHLARESSVHMESRQRVFKRVVDRNEPLYWRRKVHSAFYQWRDATHPHRPPAASATTTTPSTAAENRKMSFVDLITRRRPTNAVLRTQESSRSDTGLLERRGSSKLEEEDDEEVVERWTAEAAEGAGGDGTGSTQTSPSTPPAFL